MRRVVLVLVIVSLVGVLPEGLLSDGVPAAGRRDLDLSTGAKPSLVIVQVSPRSPLLRLLTLRDASSHLNAPEFDHLVAAHLVRGEVEGRGGRPQLVLRI